MASKKRNSEEAAVGTRRSARIANSTPPAAPPEPHPKKKKVTTAPAKKEKLQNDAELKPTADGHTKTIVIEHCKQCNQFKTRATKVKEALQTAVPSVNVLVNPVQPRRGCFEIREEGGETFISLLGMKRPFQPMRDLDMDEVISDIVKKIK